MKLVATAATIALLGVLAIPAALAATPTLVGTDGPGFTITLTKGGKKVSKLKAGTYVFKIADKSSIHNFTIEREKGGKIEKELTDTSFQGKKTVTVTLKKGSWKFYCSSHESQMFGFFKVTS